jgi:hypothetical protein
MSVPVDVIRRSLPDGLVADQDVLVSAGEVPVSDGAYPVRKFIVVKAADDNSAPIYVGAPGDAIHGFKLLPGESTPQIPIDRTDKVAVACDTPGQGYSWFGI